MSRSVKKTKIRVITTAVTEKKNKQYPIESTED